MAKIIVQVGTFNQEGEFEPMTFGVVEYDYCVSPPGEGTFRSLVVQAKTPARLGSIGGRKHPLLDLFGDLPLDTQHLFRADEFNELRTLPSLLDSGVQMVMQAWADYGHDRERGEPNFEDLFRDQRTFEQMLEEGTDRLAKEGRDRKLYVRVIMQAEQHDFVFKPYSAPTPKDENLATMLRTGQATRQMIVKGEAYLAHFRNEGELAVTSIRRQRDGETVWSAAALKPMSAIMAFHIAKAGLGLPETMEA